MMVKGYFRKALSIFSFFGLMSAPLVGQDIARKTFVSDYSHYVMFESVSFGRIQDRQKYISKVLDEQATTRRATVFCLSATVLAVLTGGSVYGYYQYNKPAPPQESIAVNPNRHRLEERYWQRFEEAHTFQGALKNGIRNGFGYAAASISTVAAMALFDKAGLISWKAIKDSLYPTTPVLCQEQEECFKNYFDYLNAALHEFEDEISRIESPDQLAEFIKWRGLISLDVKSSVVTMVRSVEDFAALSFEFIQRKAADTPQEELPIHKFNELVGRIDVLAEAVNGFTLVLEQVANATDVAQLKHDKVPLAMTFKNSVQAARNAMQLLLALVAVV
jgi:hypothetical protein